MGVDGTGLTPGAVSTCFVKRLKECGGTGRRWGKGLIAVDVVRRAILAQQAHSGPVNDSATWRPLVAAARSLGPRRAVVADAEFDSERNHRFLRDQVGAASAIPAQRGRPTWRIRGIRAQMRRHCPGRLYGQRALVESVISAAKRKRSARAPGRSPLTQEQQALRLGLADNISRLQQPCQPVV